jgi:glycosyltransferase
VKISLITVTYNCVETIEETIASISNQTFRDFEWIVIDGGSSDGTLKLIKSYNLHTILVSESDRGIYDALNKGISLASGNIIGILHGDDTFVNQDTLQTINDVFDLNSVTDGIYGDLLYVSRYKKKIIRSWRSGYYTPSKIKYGWMAPHPTIFLKMEIFKKVGFYKTQYKISSDYDFIIRLFSNNVVMHYINEPLVSMKMGGVSNRSIGLLFEKLLEDIQVVRSNNAGNIFTIICKCLRKLPQFLCSYSTKRK